MNRALALVLALAPALGSGSEFTRGNRAPADWLEPTSAIAIAGLASRYDPGLMAIAMGNQGLELSAYHRGAVSLMRRGDLGRDVWIRINGRREWLGPFLSVDCAGRADYAGLVKADRVIELSAADWRDLGLPEDLVSVVVSFAEWPREIRGRYY